MWLLIQGPSGLPGAWYSTRPVVPMRTFHPSVWILSWSWAQTRMTVATAVMPPLVQ
jgi:hypothetical protein